MKNADIGLIGLAVMGKNLALNMATKGFCVAVYNRTLSKVTDLIDSCGKEMDFIPCTSIPELCASLKKPRRVMMMVKAGKPVDTLIAQLLEYMEPGDVIIDGGNAHFSDTIRRCSHVESAGLYYIGVGVSGGEEGALKGPSMMPGGSVAAWPLVKPVFYAISANVNNVPCCNWVGESGAGHFVKMVHNGIEYGDMQLICEAYHLMRDYLGMRTEEMSAVFDEWNEGELGSYLIQITRDILAFKDVDGQPLLDKILDTAGQKGTGKWTAITALEEGIPLTLIGEAVFARCLSAIKEERMAAADILSDGCPVFDGDRTAFLNDLRDALYASKIVSYAQGYQLMRASASHYNWNLNYGGIALMWRGGCIIRSVFLNKIYEAYVRNSELTNLVLDEFFASELKRAHAAWRRICSHAMLGGIPVPAMSSALSWYDGYRCKHLPSNLLQAQRDYFGAHTYERIDAPRGEFFHTNWTGEGSSTTSSAYNV